jgi:hypothetical protein
MAIGEAVMAGDRPVPPRRSSPRNKKSPEPVRAERPFDVWLNRQLHSMYDDIASAPLPRDVLDLIEHDRRLAEGEAKETTPAAGDGHDVPPQDVPPGGEEPDAGKA